ncbi:MAG: PAS domain S-box protein, partial [FCB group bacterium]
MPQKNKNEEEKNIENIKIPHFTEVKHKDLSLQLEYLTKYANDIIILKDEKGNLVQVNDKAVKQYGFSKEKLLKMTINQLRAPENRLSLEADMEHIAASNGL